MIDSKNNCLTKKEVHPKKMNFLLLSCPKKPENLLDSGNSFSNCWRKDYAVNNVNDTVGALDIGS